MYKLPEVGSTKRLSDWYRFRDELEFSEDPLEDVHRYFQQFPKVKVYTDPYDQQTWPTPWELINENEYCQFNIILGICYTLQLTNRFKNISPTISISIDNADKVVYYLLFIDDKVYGYDQDGWILAKNLPKTLKKLKIYRVPYRY